MLHKSIRILIISMILVPLLAACSDGGGEETSPEATGAPREPAVRSAGAVSVNGRVAPVKHANLSFSNSGRVIEILVQEGQQVNEGDVLARLGSSEAARAELAAAQLEQLQAKQALDALTNDLAIAQTDAKKRLFDAKQEEYDAQRNVSYQAEDSQLFTKQQASDRLEIAKARVAEAQAEYDLLQSGPNPLKLAEAEARLQSSEAQVSAAQASLDSLVLRAPFGGTVVKIDIAEGELAVSGTTVVVLADLTSWVVETDDLTEIKVVRINVGQPVTIVPDALPDAPMTGTVSYIREVFEEKRGDITYTARIAVTEIFPGVRWGMTVVVNFTQ